MECFHIANYFQEITGDSQIKPEWNDMEWRARLVADGTGLENRKGFALLVGSNPTPSALCGLHSANTSTLESVRRNNDFYLWRRRLARSMAPAC